MIVGKYGLSVAQLSEVLPDATEEMQKRKRKQKHAPAGSSAGCGCCPICHAFVYAEFTQPGDLATCAQCGGLIDRLDALGGPASK